MFTASEIFAFFGMPALFAAGAGEIIVLLLVVIAPLLQAVIASYNDYKEKRKVKETKEAKVSESSPEQFGKVTKSKKRKSNKQAYINEYNEIIPVEILVEPVNLDSQPASVGLSATQSTSSNSQNIPSISQSEFEHGNEIYSSTDAFQPNQTKNNKLAADILEIFSKPATVQQAILISEILRRPDEKTFHSL
ncbi:MAG: hypothetical protein ACRC2T_10465 [Thermoguttaceae bacterium]